MEGLIKEILKKENITPTDNVRENMEKLLGSKILKDEPLLRVEGQKIELELAHAYGIYSLLSYYLNHYNEQTEEDLHFIFFQSVGLIWLILNRYLRQKNKGRLSEWWRNRQQAGEIPLIIW